MATLAANSPRKVTSSAVDFEELPMIAADKIFEGAAVGDNGSGFARPLVAGDPFKGFAETEQDNTAGAAGDLNVKVRVRGYFRLAVAALVAADLGKPVYASDDDTFVLTEGANSYVGRVVRFEAAGIGMVSVDANGSLGLVAELTDSTGGTADGTVADVGASFNQTTLNNNFADLIAKINSILRQIG
jgi:hypothetical protein